MTKCGICGQRKATKTNSHLIPSFIIAMVSSYDGSYKRDKEMLFTFESILSFFYAGRGVLDPNYLEYFKSISEEKQNIIKDYQYFAPDFIFCPECEKKIGDFLESKYSANKHKLKNDGLISIMFWLSVIWRISKFGSEVYKLPNEYEEVMGALLNEYLQNNGKIQDKANFLNRIPFSYKIVFCADYCKTNAGYISGQYDRETNSATYFMGDFILQVYFSNTTVQNDVFGLKSIFDTATLNTGQDSENKQTISPEKLRTIYDSLLNYCCKLRYQNDKDYFKGLWNILRCQLGSNIPQKPNKKICAQFISKIYNKSQPYRIVYERERVSVFVRLVYQKYSRNIFPYRLA